MIRIALVIAVVAATTYGALTAGQSFVQAQHAETARIQTAINQAAGGQ